MAVLNKYKVGGYPAQAIYIGRGSKWGNPFVIGPDGDRNSVCNKHAEYLFHQIDNGDISLEELAALHGKDLVCFCAPQRCHGHELEKQAKWAFEMLKLEN